MSSSSASSSSVNIIFDEPEKTYKEDRYDAFHSKVGAEDKEDDAPGYRFTKPLQKVMLHQSNWKHGTWIVDEVHFGVFTYVFFVEANTRYLVAVQFNTNTDDSAAPSLYAPTNPQNTDNFISAFNQFCNIIGGKQNCSHIVFDSAKIHLSRATQHRLMEPPLTETTSIVAADNHTPMAILDRLVRTIRDMTDKLGYGENVSPPQMVRAVVIYNTSKHRRLSEVLGKPTTPKEVHENELLEKRFIQGLRKENYVTASRNGFLIPIGAKVVIRLPSGVLQKRRSSVRDGNWVVTQRRGIRYTVRNEDNDEMLTVPRRDLRLSK